MSASIQPFYDDGMTVVYHGDCREILPCLPPADLIFTSPPYNLAGAPWAHLGHWKPGDSTGGKTKWRNGSDAGGGVAYADHEDAMPHDQYVAWQRDILRLCWDRTTERGAIFYNHKPRVIGGRLWLPLELNPDLPLRQIVVWARAGGLNFNPTAFVPTHEWIMILARPAWRLRSKGVSGFGDVWSVAQEANPLHPAPFPLGLPVRAIEATGPGLVIDPFMGSGTTLRAAKDVGIRSIGIEISREYCEIAVNRLAQAALPLGA